MLHLNGLCDKEIEVVYMYCSELLFQCNIILPMIIIKRDMHVLFGRHRARAPRRSISYIYIYIYIGYNYYQ